MCSVLIFFQRVTPKVDATISHELYVFHRWGIIRYAVYNLYLIKLLGPNIKRPNTFSVFISEVSVSDQLSPMISPVYKILLPISRALISY